MASEIETEVPLHELYGACAKALKKAYRVVRELGDDGRKEIDAKAESGINRGKKVLVADLRAEEAVIETLKQHKLPIRMISEEHGEFDLSPNPQYLGILDGLDGSNLYRDKGKEARVGTMFGIFEGLNPSYDDYLYSGIIEHPDGRLFFAEKGQGAFIYTPAKEKEERGRTEAIKASKIETIEGAEIYIDVGRKYNREFFVDKMKELQWKSLRSLSVHHMNITSGNAHLSLDCTGKRNLELAVSYGLHKQAGAVMVTMDGRTIGQRKYLEFGQGKDEEGNYENIPVITACTQELARALIQYLNHN